MTARPWLLYTFGAVGVALWILMLTEDIRFVAGLLGLGE